MAFAYSVVLLLVQECFSMERPVVEKVQVPFDIIVIAALIHGSTRHITEFHIRLVHTLLE